MIRSFRLRVALLILIIGLLPTVMLKQIILNNYSNHVAETIISDVKGKSSILRDKIGEMTLSEFAVSSSIKSDLVSFADNYHGRIMIINEDFQIIEDTFGDEKDKMITSDLVFACFQGESRSYFDAERNCAEFVLPIYENSDRISGAFLMILSTHKVVLSAKKLSNQIDSILLILSIVILLYAIISAYLLHRPFRRLERSIEAVADGYANELKTENVFSETEQISISCQRMLERLNALNESRQQFVADVSHELKTPLTSMKVLSDSLLLMKDPPVEMYREFMSDLSEEIERENKIINNLLALVKMDKNASNMEIESVNVNQMVERVLKLLRPIAKKYDIELIYESVRPVNAEIDETKLSLAIMNLVENAIKYNRKHGWVHVTLNADHKNFHIEIADSGIGIPDEAIPHIFERFYRVDKSHSTEIKGTGLGLALSKSIIAMHRGSVQVFSKVGKGTTMVVRIPLIYSILEAGGKYE